MTLKAHQRASTPNFLGIEIGGTKLQIVTGKGDGQILERHRFQVEAARGADGIREQIQTALPAIMREARPSAIGVGYGGPVNWRTGQIVKSYHVKGWHEFPLGAWLERMAGIPVFVENDANVASYGEALIGAGRGRDPVFYVTVGSGVGGGLVNDGRIYHGYGAGEAEIGHVWLNKDGVRPEDCCSGWSLDRLIRDVVERSPVGPLADFVKASSGNEARHLAPALAVGDACAKAVLEEAAENLALALSHATHLFQPEIIVIGGGVSLIGEPYREAVARHLSRMVMDAFFPGPPVTLAGLREDAVPCGALALAAERLKISLHANS